VICSPASQRTFGKRYAEAYLMLIKEKSEKMQGK